MSHVVAAPARAGKVPCAVPESATWTTRLRPNASAGVLRHGVSGARPLPPKRAGARADEWPRAHGGMVLGDRAGCPWVRDWLGCRHSTIVTAVVDGVAGLVVVVDTAYTAAHKTPAAKTTTTQPT